MIHWWGVYRVFGGVVKSPHNRLSGLTSTQHGTNECGMQLAKIHLTFLH